MGLASSPLQAISDNVWQYCFIVHCKLLTCLSEFIIGCFQGFCLSWVVSPFPSLLSCLLTRSKLKSSVKGTTLQVTCCWYYVSVQGQEERCHRPVQSFLPRNWKKVWSSIPHYPYSLKKDLISSQTPTSKETFFLEITSTELGLYLCLNCCPACTPRELLVREDEVLHRKRSLQGILPLRDFRLAIAVLCRGFFRSGKGPPSSFLYSLF